MVRTRVVTAGSVGSGEPNFDLAVVVVDFQKQRTPPCRSAEVVLAVGIVVFAEGGEGADLLRAASDVDRRQRLDAGGDHDGAADEGPAEGVVEGADAFGGGHGCAGHWLDLLRLGMGNGARPVHGHARNEEGRPEGRPAKRTMIVVAISSARATCP